MLRDVIVERPSAGEARQSGRAFQEAVIGEREQAFLEDYLASVLRSTRYVTKDRQVLGEGAFLLPREDVMPVLVRLRLDSTFGGPVRTQSRMLAGPQRSTPRPRRERSSRGVSERRFHIPPAAPRAAMSQSSNTPTPRSGSIARDTRLPPRRRRRGRERGHGQEARRAKAPGTSAPAVDSGGCRPSPIGTPPCGRSIRSCRRTGRLVRAGVRNRRQGSSP